ncbi:MAG: lipoprotein signal peptidase [Flavobacteriaceae bacterium]|nr:lipoprotein signal peptidase [Flavobacteriaceae bacterium]
MTHKKALWLILIVLVLDQCSKLYIKLHYPLTLYGSDAIVDWGWFRLIFIENKGMAWGTKISDFLPFISEDTGKLLLSIFRLGAVSVIGYWLWDALKKKQHKLLLIAGSLIFAGAIGNIIDSLFYGLLFSDSYGQIAQFLPDEGGYAPLFFGQVVDMLQFPMFTWVWPEWLPWIGGNSFTFFEPVFNLADTAISTGVGIVLVFNKKIFPKD